MHFEGVENANFTSGGIRAKNGEYFEGGCFWASKLLFLLLYSLFILHLSLGRFFRYDDAFLDTLEALADLKFESKKEVDGQGVRRARGPNDECNVV